MGRLILAYGQVKAAAYLRGSEVRQFTEAGVNMYGELQDYFKEVKGEAYTTAQIVDMISKRMVKFEDVEAIFQRMTDKGGMFYNMQEVQSNTLYGMIQKMNDAFDVMLNDIGKANEGSFKGLINSATQLLKHWEAIANTGKILAGVIALMALYMKQMGVSKVSSLFTQIISSEGRATSSTILFKNALAQAGNYAKVLGQNLKAAFASNIFTLSILALTSVVAGTISALRELREAEAEIGAKYYKNTAQLNMISEAYESISKSASKANKSESDKSSIATIEAKRKKLQELLNLSKSSGLDFNINVQFINADKIDETFDDIKSKYKSFVTQMAVIEHKLAESKSLKDNWYIPVDDFEKDAKQYSAAAAELLTHANQIDDAVIAISGHQEEATERTRAYYQEVKAGRKAGESELDYYERMYILLEKIGKENRGL